MGPYGRRLPSSPSVHAAGGYPGKRQEDTPTTPSQQAYRLTVSSGKRSVTGDGPYGEDVTTGQSPNGGSCPLRTYTGRTVLVPEDDAQGSQPATDRPKLGHASPPGNGGNRIRIFYYTHTPLHVKFKGVQSTLSLRGSGPPSRVISPRVRPRPFPPGMDPGVRSRHRIQDANPVCAFSPVLGARCPVLGVDPVPGPGSQVPGTRDLEPGTRRLSSKNPHTGYARCRKSPGGGQSPNLHPISAFRNLARHKI